MSILKQPGWLRAIEIATGVLTVAFAILVLIYGGLAIATLIVLLAIGLIFAGVRSISLADISCVFSRSRSLAVVDWVISGEL